MEIEKKDSIIALLEKMLIPSSTGGKEVRHPKWGAAEKPLLYLIGAELFRFKKVTGMHVPLVGRKTLSLQVV